MRMPIFFPIAISSQLVLGNFQVKLDISPLALETADVMLGQVLEQKKMSQGLSNPYSDQHVRISYCALRTRKNLEAEEVENAIEQKKRLYLLSNQTYWRVAKNSPLP